MPPIPDLLGSIRKHWCCFASSPPATPPPQLPTICSTDKSKERGLNLVGGEDFDAKMVHPQFLKSSSSDCVSTDMQEKSSPWSLLPSDILEQALALLPLPEVFRLCCVCKRWNALIHYAQFQEWYLYLHALRWTERKLCVISWSSYDLAKEKWIHMPQFKFSLLNQTSSWDLVTANGGLVCFGSEDGRQTLVCSPLTNMWRELPFGRLDSKSTVINYMIVDKQRTSYKILFAGNAAHRCEDPRYGMVDLYDSISNTWSIGQNLSVCNQLASGAYFGKELASGAYYNGKFYVLTWHCQKHSFAILKLDLTTLKWREETIPILEKFNYCPFIVACSGRIYLVGGRDNRFRHPYGSVVIFQLERSNNWIKVSEYSNERFELLGTICGCWSNGSKIHVVKYSWVAVYDCATSCWEGPIHIGADDDPNMQKTFQTRFTFQPNLQDAP